MVLFVPPLHLTNSISFLSKSIVLPHTYYQIAAKIKFIISFENTIKLKTDFTLNQKPLIFNNILFLNCGSRNILRVQLYIHSERFISAVPNL